jgi:hypothetical protein
MDPVIEQACKADPNFWFEHFVKTRDPQDYMNPVKPWPNYDFLKEVIREICLRKDDGKPVNPRIAVPKSRQMLISWTCCACSLWLAKFWPHRHNFLQSQKETKAKELLERCAFIEHHHPPDLGGKFEFTASMGRGENGSKIEAVAQGPDQLAQYTPSQVVMDEMALQETSEAAYRSMIPALRAGGQLVGPSTPRGINFFWKFVHEIPATKVMKVHYRQHPDFIKQAEKMGGWRQWVDYMIKKEGYDLQTWKQEMEIDFDVAFGAAVFNPPFGKDTHVSSGFLQANPAWDIHEGWDFGFVHPATVWFQHNPYTEQQIVLRELMGTRVSLPDYIRNQVLPMRKELARHGRFVSYCDPAGVAHTDKGDRSVDTMNNYGIYPQYKKSSIDAGVELIRINLGIRPDGTPRTIIDPRCSMIINALNGGVVYKDVENEDEAKQRKIVWGRYKHIMDAWRYGQIHVYDLANVGQFRKKPKKHAPHTIGPAWARNRHHKSPTT